MIFDKKKKKRPLMEVSGAVKLDVQDDPRTEEKRGHNTGKCPGLQAVKGRP
jgi:hypothetical protein